MKSTGRPSPLDQEGREDTLIMESTDRSQDTQYIHTYIHTYTCGRHFSLTHALVHASDTTIITWTADVDLHLVVNNFWHLTSLCHIN